MQNVFQPNEMTYELFMKQKMALSMSLINFNELLLLQKS